MLILGRCTLNVSRDYPDNCTISLQTGTDVPKNVSQRCTLIVSRDYPDNRIISLQTGIKVLTIVLHVSRRCTLIVSRDYPDNRFISLQTGIKVLTIVLHPYPSFLPPLSLSLINKADGWPQTHSQRPVSGTYCLRGARILPLVRGSSGVVVTGGVKPTAFSGAVEL